MDEVTAALHIYSGYLPEFLSALLFVRLYRLEASIRENYGTLENEALPVSTDQHRVNDEHKEEKGYSAGGSVQNQ